MQLEAELKTSKPLPPHQRAFLNILFTASWLDCYIHRCLRPFGITHPQYNILRILNGSYPKGLSVLDIKERMIDRSSNVSRLVDKLHKSGYVERSVSRKDRRMAAITITEAGRALLKSIHETGFADFKKMPGHHLTELEARELADLLDKFRE
ncbi:MAG: MarR family transcriptional regulator [Saprospiraceae bacterium]|nr:MarR family transcriptional regulator [Saprospiraceae bacterium]MDW8484547.1 MarR family transcriptional regulator [Saprospiraceae bacterium]